MAEFVEFRTEEMVPELEQLERLRIFNEVEIRNIIKTRKSFQYKIQRRTKCVEDYVRYIQYEMDLLMLVKSRKNKLGLGGKRCEVDMLISNRVNKLFEQALLKFNDDINLWLSYMKFCKQIRVFSVCVSNMLVRMLASHGQKPGLWKLAANWEFEENKSIENACQFIMRGLRHHPNSKMLYIEAFRLELIYADIKRNELELKKTEVNQVGKQIAPSASSAAPVPMHSGTVETDQSAIVMEHFPEGHSSQNDALHLQDPNSLVCDAIKNDSSDPVIDCRNAEFVYATALKRFPNASFLISFLNIAKKFSFTEKLQNIMAKDLLRYSPNDELTWDVLARRELEGLHFIPDPSTDEEFLDTMEHFVEESTFTPKNRTEKLHYKRIRNFFTIYQRGLQYLKTDRIWELYLDTLIELNQDGTILKKAKRKLLISAFQEAHDEGHLQEKYYILWADMRGVGKDKIPVILLTGTEKFPSSVELWQKRLEFHLSEDQEHIAMAVFKDAIACLGCGASTLPIWKMVIQYWETKSADIVEEVFQEGIKQGSGISSEIKPMYLEWLASTKGIRAARAVYDTVCIQPPFCSELHEKMAALEGLQPKVKMSRVVKCYELACEQFGKGSTDVWMEYIKFEVNRGDPKKIKEIYHRALKSLEEELAHNFISIFCEYWVIKNLED